MRVSVMLLFAACCCGGCAAPPGDVTRSLSGVSSPDVKNVPTAAEEPLAAADAPRSEAAAEPPAAPLTKEEVTALVKSVLAEEFAKHDRQQAEAMAQAEKLAEQERAATEAAQRAAKQAAETTNEQAAHDAAKTAQAAEQAARQEDEALASFLLLPDELKRVERISQKLEVDNLWGLSLQDLDFAAEGLAAPLLHDALYRAAERFDPNIEMDVLAKKAQLTPQEKIQFATMPPIERQQLLMFTEQLDQGQKSVAGDRYIREYINRYPFIRKILLPYLNKQEVTP